MAKFNFTIPKEFQEQLSKYSDVEEIAPKMIDEATPILVKSIQRRLAIHKDTGDLIKSATTSKAKKIKNGGYYARIFFKGYDAKKVANNIKAVNLEYGNVRGEPAQPFMDASINDVEQQVVNKMQEVFNREVG